VIEAMINKQLIQQYCQRANIQVTDQDVAVEIDRLARKFGMTSDDYLKMLKQERGIQPQQYGSEIIWPTLALRRLAAQKIQPTQQELDQAFESQYGEAVKARIIVLETAQEAQQVYAQVAATKTVEEFATIARKSSRDPSASVNGMIQPIRRHVGDKAIEVAAFQMQEGQISQVIPITFPGVKPEDPGTQKFVILKCEGRVPPTNVDRKTVEMRLADSITDRKLRDEAAKIYQELQKTADIKNVFNNPELKPTYPGMVAVVNGAGISQAQLLEECVLRNGTDVLESVINRHLLEQTLKNRNLQVTQEDIQAEIAKAAVTMGKRNANGGADVEGWIKSITEENGCSAKVYIEDAVWPSVALKKIAGSVQVNDEDLQKGYQANYGPKVRCRAILQDNMHKAQELWTLARQNPTAEAFGQLAKQYSTDTTSKSMDGRIPPIQRFGGQPLIEGQLSR
jgi:parvulin-like peptidyl-prolyl isomerase